MQLSHWAYFALMVCLAGVIYRMGRWFALRIGAEAQEATFGRRMCGAFKAVACIFASPRRLGILVRTLLLEILLQTNILKQDWRRWLMHMTLFYGILLLVLLHVFDDSITAYLFDDYAATLNPFQWLRHLLGALVLIGVGMAVLRRPNNRRLRLARTKADRWALVLLSAIVISGVVLEAVQIISPAIFEEMVADYMGSDDPQEIAPLKSYWAAEFHVAFAAPVSNNDPVSLAQGRDLHAQFCAQCHSRPQSAVLSFPLAQVLKPLSADLQRLRMDLWLWKVHFLISCLALALLPFSKLFHLLSTSLSLMIRSLGDAASDLAANRSTRRVLGLDACVHCGVCSQHCAVAPVYQVMANAAILPSEKLAAVARATASRNGHGRRTALSEGSFICTQCGRCTRWCPAGIDLQDLWQASRHDLIGAGYPPPHGWIQTRTAAQWAATVQPKPTAPKEPDAQRQPGLGLTDNPGTFWACVQCTTCTNVCPVVAASEDPQRDLDMTPQQVMNMMRLQLKDMALGSRMVWDCLTCYKCQEHCPQGVRVADIIYELRNEAYHKLKAPEKMNVEHRTSNVE